MESEPPKSGPERFQRWRSTLFVDPDASDVEAKLEYFRLRESLSEKFAKVTRVSAGCDGEIMRDVIRTFQKQRFFQRGQPGQRMLLHILFGLAAARPDVGYCQGMNYVVASLLLGRIPEIHTDIDHINPVAASAAADGDGEAEGEIEGEQGGDDAAPDPDAEQQQPHPDRDSQEHGASGGFEVAASVVRAVVISDEDGTGMTEEQMDAAEADVYLFMMELLSPGSKLDMAGMWKEKIPKLKLRIYQLDRLLRWSFPHLHAHFTAIELSPEVITAQWFLTLFTYTFPVVPTVLQLWDYIFLTGWEGLFKVALSLLGSLQPKLLELQDFESIVMLMREWKREGTLIIQESMPALLHRASKFIINTEVLHKLQESFASEILTIALIRAQFLNNERESSSVGGSNGGSGVNSVNNSVHGTSGGSSSGGVYSAFASLTSSNKDRHTPSPVNISSGSNIGSGNRGSGNHFVPLALQNLNNPTSTSNYNTNPNTPYISTSSVGIASGVSTTDTSMNNSPASSYTGYSTESSAKASGLNSLSNTERRKEILRIQERELAIEAQIMSGAEAPVFWLLRYGSKLPEKTLQELRKIKLDLLALDDQVDVDKQQIQTKIIKACEMNRETQDELSAAELALHEASATVEQGKSSLQSALLMARQVALEVVQLMEGKDEVGGGGEEGGGGGSGVSGVGMSGEDSGKSTSTNNSTASTTNTTHTTHTILDHGTIPAFGSYGGSSSSTNGSGGVVFSGGSGGSAKGSGECGDGSSTGSSSGLRFPTMPWSHLRNRDRTGSGGSSKKNNSSTSSGGIASSGNRHSSGSSGGNIFISLTANTHNSSSTPRDSSESADTNTSINVRHGSEDNTVDTHVSNVRQIGSDQTHEVHIGLVQRLSQEEGSDLDDQDADGIAGSTNNSSANTSTNNSTCTTPTRHTVHLHSSSSATPTSHITHIAYNSNMDNTSSGNYGSTSSISSSGGGGGVGFNVRSSSPNPSGHSGGLLSSLSLSTSRLHWNFPVVRAVHQAAGIPCERLGIGAGGREVSAKLTTKQMKQLERRGQWVQQQIIDIDRALEESKRNLEFARRRLEQAKISNDETVTWKNSLCDQLHLLVRDSNRGRSQKLMFVAENYNI